MTYEEVIKQLSSMASPEDVAGMARFGIRPKTEVLGISIWELRKIAKKIGPNHGLAQKLWDYKVHEARILAGFIEEPTKVTEAQAERWVKDFDSWDIVDQVSDVFTQTPFWKKKIREWSRRKEEFVKRTAFAMMAEIAWRRTKDVPDKEIEFFFPLIKREATDERNFVRKAVNWALRNIGKRRPGLKERAIQTAKGIQRLDSKSARWIAADALRELSNKL